MHLKSVAEADLPNSMQLTKQALQLTRVIRRVDGSFSEFNVDFDPHHFKIQNPDACIIVLFNSRSRYNTFDNSLISCMLPYYIVTLGRGMFLNTFCSVFDLDSHGP